MDQVDGRVINWARVVAHWSAVDRQRLECNCLDCTCRQATRAHGLSDDEDYSRASGGCECSICGEEYWRHPADGPNAAHQDHRFLIRLCDGRLVKL